MLTKLILFFMALCGVIIPSSKTFTIHNNKPQNSSTDDQFSIPVHEPRGYRNEELINQQSENIRHIIANEQRNQERDKQVKKEKSIVTIEDERFPTLEELRAKCQHFSRLFGLTQSGNNAMEHYVNGDMSTGTSVRPIIEVTRRPVFIRNKPTFIQKNNGGFYVTASPIGNEITTARNGFWSSSTSYPRVAYIASEHNTIYTSTKPTTSTISKMTTTFYVSNPKVKNTTDVTTTTARPKIKIKYTKFEPVILQKTILTDGRVLYHWHRSLPTAAVDLPASISPIATPIQPSTYDYPSVPATMPTKSTTTEKSSWLFVPFSSLFGGSNDEETTTVETNTVTPTTYSSTNPNKLEMENRHSTTEETRIAEQLKLVVPVHYDDLDTKLAAHNNRLPYYRKAPETAPSLQVIKAFGVPHSIPGYSLGYTGTGFGFINDGIPFGRSYGPGYTNYQAYSNVPLERHDKRLDDVSV